MCIIYPYAGLIGNVVGVLIVNLASPLGALDLISVVVNIPALACIVVLRNKKYLKYIGGLLYAFIISVYVAILLTYLFGIPFWLLLVQVFIAEAFLATSGIVIFNYIGGKLPY